MDDVSWYIFIIQHMLCIQWFDFITHLFINANFRNLKDQNSDECFSLQPHFHCVYNLLQSGFNITTIDKVWLSTENIQNEFSAHVSMSICHSVGITWFKVSVAEGSYKQVLLAFCVWIFDRIDTKIEKEKWVSTQTSTFI